MVELKDLALWAMAFVLLICPLLSLVALFTQRTSEEPGFERWLLTIWLLAIVLLISNFLVEIINNTHADVVENLAFITFFVSHFWILVQVGNNRSPLKGMFTIPILSFAMMVVVMDIYGHGLVHFPLWPTLVLPTIILPFVYLYWPRWAEGAEESDG